ncbi:adhesion G protein-coupled receptor E3-like [Heptranchias perlo]|uniref:adhesion G protein-coupled receptor E3-like n=1 Tax=Heptranchias perlo TaxID=212740 RepID=UPI00355ACB9D
MVAITSSYLIVVSYLGKIMNRFIITSENCSPPFYRQGQGFCVEIDQQFISDTVILNNNWCLPGFYFNRRRFCINLTYGRQEDIKIGWCVVSRKCFIAPGNRSCTCAKRYKSITTEGVFSGRCLDIDECLKHPCSPQEVCTNTFGNYTCSTSTCIDQNQFNTKHCSFIHWEQQTQSPWYTFHQYCSVINSIVALVNQQCQNHKSELISQKILSITNDLLGNDSLWDNMEKEERLYLASVFLQSVENAAIVAGQDLPDRGKRIESIENIELEIRTFRGKSTSAADRIRLQAKGNFMDIYRSTVTGRKTAVTGFAAVALIAYNNMDSILIGSVFNLSTSGGKLKPFRLISNVVSAAITNRDSRGLDPTVNITFRHKEEANGDGTIHCVHWNYAAGESYWSPNGCSMADSNGTHTQCRCNQFSNLAVLITPFEWQSEPPALTIITFIGIPISLVCLAVAIATFVFCKQLKSAVTATHVQLCVSLFLAELLFITGIDRTRNRVVCGIVAGFLHYLFLAAFVWMFLEGVQLYLMVRNIRKLRASHSEKIEKYMYLCGYGTPAVIVVISAAVYPDGYGSSMHCWLRTHRGFTWSFLGPVCVIIGINTFLFLTTLWTLKKEVSKRDMAVSKLQDTRMLAFKAIAQVFILGCTWILGLFHFGEEALVMAYLFIIVNSFQGAFIFIILCVLNSRVRTEYRKWFSMMCWTKKIFSLKNLAPIMPMPAESNLTN